LLNDILDLSKVEAGKFQLDLRAFEPQSLLRETQTLFSGAAKSKNLQLDCQWQGPPGQRYVADPHRLRQMISNLVGNAIKFTPQGRVHIGGVEIERDEVSALLEFAVTDSGIGIDAKQLDLLFKPFSQADSSTTRKFGGSGLGLSIVSNLARAMNGSVGVTSEPQKGSRFWFRIRASLVGADQNSRQSERGDLDASLPIAETGQLHGQVLVAEDNPVNAMVIGAMLNQLGLTYTLATDGQQAVDANVQRPDLILMDLHMPVMDGYSATQTIRQWETENSQDRLPIIALTADAFEEDHQHCLAVGMDDFLTKPIAMDTLKKALSQWLPTKPTVPLRSASAVKTVRTLDRQRFDELAREITPLLEQNMFSCLAKFKALQNSVEGTCLQADIDEVGEFIQTFRFDVALERLRRAAASQPQS
jgi:CheY-like chemotaxis protein